jgi:hypothetical protein
VLKREEPKTKPKVAADHVIDRGEIILAADADGEGQVCKPFVWIVCFVLRRLRETVSARSEKYFVTD